MTGQAQAVFQRLTTTEKSSFNTAVKVLTDRFKPASKRELYLAEFSTRTRLPSETWPDYAEDLRRLATKVYPDLVADATEQIALTQFFSSITDSRVLLAVKQKVYPKAWTKR